VRDPTQLATTGQWWSKSSVQRSQARQCLERSGRRVAQVAQEPAWWFGGGGEKREKRDEGEREREREKEREKKRGEKKVESRENQGIKKKK